MVVVESICQLSSAKPSVSPVAEIHLRNAGLALFHGRETQQETGECRNRCHR